QCWRAAGAAASAPRRPLPAPATPLVGREDDLAALDGLWTRGRCISIVGAGGIGKNTLARVAAHGRQASLRDGAAWVDLAEVADAALVPGVVAQALGLEAVSAADPVPAIVAAVQPLPLLRVLD